MEALMARFDLTDAEWTIIAPLLPGAENPGGPSRPRGRGDRIGLVISGIGTLRKWPICRAVSVVKGRSELAYPDVHFRK
jgi:transposase